LLAPMLEVLGDNAELDREAEILSERTAGLFAQLEALVADNARRAQDQAEYNQRYAELRSRYDIVKARQSEIAEEKRSRAVRRENILLFIETLRAQKDLLGEFEEKLFRATVERITIHAADDVRIKFRDGGREVKAGAK